jgi:hypothetical protein
MFSRQRLHSAIGYCAQTEARASMSEISVTL